MIIMLCVSIFSKLIKIKIKRFDKWLKHPPSLQLITVLPRAKEMQTSCSSIFVDQHPQKVCFDKGDTGRHFGREMLGGENRWGFLFVLIVNVVLIIRCLPSNTLYICLYLV